VNSTLLIGLVAAVAASFASLLVAARQFSGRIGTSPAVALWQESANIRKDYSDRIKILEERLLRLEEKNDGLALENLELRRQVEEQGRTILLLQNEIVELRAEKEALKREAG
jgi:hypothetical protein